MSTSPDLELQNQAEAATSESDIPGVYSTLAEEYEVVTEAVGLVDRSHIGRLKLAGADALDLINRLPTNKLEDLTPGRGMGTVITSSKGRIVDLLFVFMASDHLLTFTSPENRQKVIEWIDFYTFAEDITVQDLNPETAMFSLVWPKTANLLDEIAGQGMSAMSRYDVVTTSIGGIGVTLVRTDFGALPAYDLIVPIAQAQKLWNYLLGRGLVSDIRPIGADAMEIVRVEQGVAVYGRELSEDYNPLEADLREFISFDKGCYTGQEVVARLDTYDKVSKYLVGLSWDSDVTPAPNASLLVDGKKAGIITSAVKSRRLSKGVGMGYVRKAQAEPDSTLTLESADGDVEVRVEELPFKS